jgi:hypothetical protein
MNVIPLDANLVRGSHGLLPAVVADAPVLISSRRCRWTELMPAVDVRDVILEHVFGADA